MRRRLRGSAGVLVVVALLTGCAAASFPELERPRTSGDELSGYLDAEGVDVDSARLVDEHEGTRVHLTRSTDPRYDACLVLDGGDDDWTVACGRGITTSIHGGPTYSVRAPADDGWTQVSESVWRRD